MCLLTRVLAGTWMPMRLPRGRRERQTNTTPGLHLSHLHTCAQSRAFALASLCCSYGWRFMIPSTSTLDDSSIASNCSLISPLLPPVAVQQLTRIWKLASWRKQRRRRQAIGAQRVWVKRRTSLNIIAESRAIGTPGRLGRPEESRTDASTNHKFGEMLGETWPNTPAIMSVTAPWTNPLTARYERSADECLVHGVAPVGLEAQDGQRFSRLSHRRARLSEPRASQSTGCASAWPGRRAC